MLKLLRLPKLGEVGQERLKRGLLLGAGCGVLLAGIKLLAAKKVVSSKSIPVSQEELVDFGGKVVDKALGILGKQTREDQTNEVKEGSKNQQDSGEVAGAAQTVKEATKDSQKVVEKVVEKKTEEIIKMIKKLPERQAERIKREVMKGICEEICEGE